jgi:hypothetical protein
LFGQLDGARGVVAARSREHRHAPVHLTHDQLDDAAMLRRGQRRILAGSPARNEKIDAAIDLKIDEACERMLIERAAFGEGRDERGA